MLQLLHIENIAIIERADISFERGFNALTGETGAGKSIVIDALGAVLGQRTSRDLIRTGAEKAFVSAVFDGVSADLPALSACAIAPEEDGTLLLQREVYADGKNVCRVNGRPITVALLREIGGSLLNIHGQHDGAQLLDEQQHLTYLDRFGRTDGQREHYRALFAVMRETQGKIASLKMDEAEKARRVDSLRHQIEELERAELQQGEEELLVARRNILRNGEKFIAAVEQADISFFEHYSVSGVAVVLVIALEIMSYMVSVGFVIFSLHVSRDETAEIGNLFDGFGIFFRALWLAILQGLLVFLWSLLLVVPGIIAAYRYRQALYLLLDHPEKSAWQCLRESGALMRGHKWELFVLDLSFLGWMLLSAMFAPVTIWLDPYRAITNANYYNRLVGAQGGPRVYEGSFTDIPNDPQS